MATKIRLTRRGAKKSPFYWIVVADSRSPRDGRFIEKIGVYNPMLPKDHGDRLKIVEDRAKHWISVGAKPTERVGRFFGANGLMPMPANPERPQKSQPKQKAQERLKEKEEKLKMAEEAAKEAAKEAAEPEKVAAAASAEDAKPAEEAAPEVKPEDAKPAEEAKADDQAAEEEKK